MHRGHLTSMFLLILYFRCFRSSPIQFLLLNFVGNMLTFLVGSKQAFEVSLADVAQTQLQGKNDVLLEFHVDDTTGANEVLFNLLS